jgi:hypothetical protein
MSNDMLSDVIKQTFARCHKVPRAFLQGKTTLSLRPDDRGIALLTPVQGREVITYETINGGAILGRWRKREVVVYQPTKYR